MSAQKYKVVVGEETFWLSQSQILNAPDSFFSCLISGDWTESLTCQLEVDRSPELFRIIFDFLKGYDVLPLAPQAIPPGWSLEATEKNLLKDALFYGLDALVELLQPPPPSREKPASSPLLGLPPLDFTRGAWSGSTPNLAGPLPLLQALPELVDFGPHGLVLATTSSRPKPTAVVFAATDVHIAFTLNPRSGTIRAFWTFLHDEQLAALRAAIPAEHTLDLNTGCAAGSITRQILLNTDTRQFSFDSIVQWAASKVSGYMAPTNAIIEDNNCLDALFCVSTPLAAPEDGIRVAMMCKNLFFAVFSGTEGAYIAPIFVSAVSLSSFWSSMGDHRM